MGKAPPPAIAYDESNISTSFTKTGNVIPCLIAKVLYKRTKKAGWVLISESSRIHPTLAMRLGFSTPGGIGWLLDVGREGGKRRTLSSHLPHPSLMRF